MLTNTPCSPILFIIFNRSDVAEKVFEQIRKIQPPRLFIAADGPRYPLKEEYERCLQTRRIVNRIDWPCEVHLLLRDQNNGCGKGVSGAITWFFNHVEEGIILEDDCLPSSDFFDFAALMLEQYRMDKRVMMITGTNYHCAKYSTKPGYYFSKHYPIWGWATWRRAWQLYDFSIPLNWREKGFYIELKAFFKDTRIAQKWAQQFDQIAHKEVDTWDTQWVYSCIKNKGYCITPLQNLVSNIGVFGTHGNTKAWVHEMPQQKMLTLSVGVSCLSLKDASMLDRETYKKHNFMYSPSFYQKLASYIGAIPFFKRGYKWFKKKLNSEKKFL